MLLETAIDPECFTRPEIMEFLRHVRRSQRILVSSVPRKWRPRVLQAMDGAQHASMARIFLEGLKNEGRIVTRPDLISPAEGDAWAAIAKKEHKRAAFSAIIFGRDRPADGTSEAYSLAEALDSDAESIRAPSTIDVEQTKAAFVRVVSPLLRHSYRALFVDPYLCGTKKGALRAIAASVRECESMRSAVDPLEVFVFVQSDTETQFFKAANGVRDLLKGEIHGLKASFDVVHLPERLESGQQVHNRFVITDRYAARFGHSFLPEHRDNSDSVDQVDLLDRPLHEKRWNEYWDCIQKAKSKGLVFRITS